MKDVVVVRGARLIADWVGDGMTIAQGGRKTNSLTSGKGQRARKRFSLDGCWVYGRSVNVAQVQSSDSGMYSPWLRGFCSH